MKSWGILLAGLLCLLGTGCAFKQQAVRIDPKLEVVSSQLGQGKSIKVVVVDERPKTTLGTRGASGVGADMTIDGDLQAIVQRSIEDGLKAHGFMPTQGDAGGRELRVEIRNLDYSIITGFWAGTLKVDCSLKGICKQGTERPYEKLHRGEFAESIQVVQGDNANNQYVSTAVSRALNALLSDRELLECLAR